MEILIVTGIFPPDIGGPATYIPQLADSLTLAGESVKVITLSDQLKGDERPYQVIRIPRKSILKKRFNQVVNMVAKKGITADVIFANGLFGEVLQANQVIKRPQVNKIVADYAWEVASRKKMTKQDMIGFNQQKNLVFNFLRRARNYPATQADSLIVPSQFLKDIVNSWGYTNKEINVIPNGFVPPPSEEKLPDGLPQNYLVYIGRLIPFKQIDKTIKLMLEMPTKYHLVIVGDGPVRKQLEQLTKKLDLEKQVHFYGRLSQSQSFHVLKKAKALLLLTTGESFSHVVLEAMAARTPVVTTHTGALPEIISHEKSGILVSSTEATALKNAIIPVLEDQALAKRLVAGAEERLSRYSWDECFSKTYQVIIDVAAGVQ